MPTLNDLIDGNAQRLDTGFTFTEGPLYHPDGFYYFVDVRESKFYRIKPGEKAELLRENTGEGNGTTFDPQGRLIQCEGGNRRVTRWPADGTFASSEVLMDRFNGKRLSRPNDVVCKSDGSVYFTNPGLRIPLGERELDPSAVYRIMPDGSNKHVPISNIRTGSLSRPMSACCMSPIRGILPTSTASSSTAPATWFAAASSPTCRRTRRSACRTG